MAGASLKPVLAIVAGGVAALVLIALYYGGGRDSAPVPDDAHAAHEAELGSRSASAQDPESVGGARGTPAVAPAAPSRSERDRAWQTELRDVSESFRNSALLIAIRENGFPCSDLTSAAQGADPLRGWHVTCRGALTYLVAVGASGQLMVEPVPVGDNLGLGRPPESLSPQQLPNQRLIPPNR